MVSQDNIDKKRGHCNLNTISHFVSQFPLNHSAHFMSLQLHLKLGKCNYLLRISELAIDPFHRFPRPLISTV